jgi:SAM-dependent methyltransferase
MSGSDRQIKRWSLLKQPIINELECFICSFKSDIQDFKIFKATDMFNAGELIRYECPNCLTIFGDLRFLMLDQSEISNDYEDLYSYYNETNTTKYIDVVFEDLPNYLKDTSKTYIDYACGKWNLFIPNLKERGYNIIGYDKYVKDTDNIVTNILPDNTKFDILINNNYIEHIINPLDEIYKIKSLVKTGGYIIFVTSCFEYVYENTHYHTFFFSDKSLDIICKKFNLSLILSKKITFDDGVFTIAKVFRVN